MIQEIRHLTVWRGCKVYFELAVERRSITEKICQSLSLKGSILTCKLDPGTKTRLLGFCVVLFALSGVVVFVYWCGKPITECYCVGAGRVV